MLRGNAPTGLVFSRQALTPMERTAEQVANIEKVVMYLRTVMVMQILSLSQLVLKWALAVEAAEAMDANVRVVSMPCTNAYDEQDQAYKDSVLTPGVKRIAIEAGVGDGWYKYVGIDGGLVCMTTFGESAPAVDLFKEFGFTVDNVIATAKSVIG